MPGAEGETLRRGSDEGAPRVESLRILVLDDSEAHLAELQAAFAISGFANVDGTTEVTLIEQRLAKDRPDLVVVDMAIADADGLAVLKRLQNDDGDALAPSVVALTHCQDERAR